MAEKKGNKTTGVQTENNVRKGDAMGITLMLIQFFFIVVAIVLIVRLFVIWSVYNPDPVYISAFTPTHEKEITKPVRGTILSYDGKPLAASVTHFNVHMDCTVQKGEYDRKKESDWLSEAILLSKDLANILGDRTEEEWFQLIKTGREKGRKYVDICKEVDYETVAKLRQAHLFRKGRNLGGYIEERTQLRQYPYGSLARRAIGSIDENNESNSNIGIEGKYDYALRGHEGVRWMRKTDRGKRVPDYDSVEVKAVNGGNVRTTLNMEIQEIAHKALYDKIMENEKIEGGCVIVMEVNTGAVRAMVNLERYRSEIPSEVYNHAVAHSGDPGSVFKLVALMTLLEDRKISTLETMVPTFGGYWSVPGQKPFKEEHLRSEHSREVSVYEAFKRSYNNVFRYLVWENYKDNPKRYTDKISAYKMTETFDFDLLGCATPSLPTPGSPLWSGTTLPSVAIGYTITVTPLHVLTLYNAVANKGKMMKPYLVESHEEDGKVYEHEPVILDGAICSTATADTLLRALCGVTTKGGTGAALVGAKFKVAGKTGTAKIPFVADMGGKQKVVYDDAQKNHRNQATFVGFFPAEKPKYTAIVVMYSRLLGERESLYGAAGVPVFKTVLDGIYALDENI